MKYNPMQLRDSKRTTVNSNFKVMNFGDFKIYFLRMLMVQEIFNVKQDYYLTYIEISTSQKPKIQKVYLFQPPQTILITSNYIQKFYCLLLIFEYYL